MCNIRNILFEKDAHFVLNRDTEQFDSSSYKALKTELDNQLHLYGKATTGNKVRTDKLKMVISYRRSAKSRPFSIE